MIIVQITPVIKSHKFLPYPCIFFLIGVVLINLDSFSNLPALCIWNCLACSRSALIKTMYLEIPESFLFFSFLFFVLVNLAKQNPEVVGLFQVVVHLFKNAVVFFFWMNKKECCCFDWEESGYSRDFEKEFKYMMNK